MKTERWEEEQAYLHHSDVDSQVLAPNTQLDHRRARYAGMCGCEYNELPKNIMSLIVW